ncbi:hypothetical protein [Coleofasciculus sp. G3-WIS-01]|uniref:hypothetical protein n=1 Tax=Coleofasciculus sp. G3-WIS-01 TaxID=3069528 RepID=UPI004064B329
MKDFRAHCAELVHFFGSLADFRGYDGAEDVAGWLNLAACIESVNYDTSYFDPGAGVCGLADIWAERQALLQQKLVTEIARFQFCWSAIEAAIDSFVPIENKPKAKVNRLCYFLKEKYRNTNNLLGYDELLNYVKLRANGDKNHRSIFRSVDNYPSFLSEHGHGVYCVYKLRNELAHGAFNIPVDSGDGDQGMLLDIIVSSRIVLLTLHFLMMAKYPSDSVEVFWKQHEIIAVPFGIYLRSIHMDDITYLRDIEYDFDS